MCTSVLGQKSERNGRGTNRSSSREGNPSGSGEQRISGNKTDPAQQNKEDIDDNGTRML